MENLFGQGDSGGERMLLYLCVLGKEGHLTQSAEEKL